LRGRPELPATAVAAADFMKPGGAWLAPVVSGLAVLFPPAGASCPDPGTWSVAEDGKNSRCGEVDDIYSEV